VEARVLGKRRYYLDPGSGLYPVDLAMGWGPMSDERVLRHIKIDQYNRYFVWRVNRFPIPRQEIEVHSANMHLIPANPDIQSKVFACRVGDIVRFDGFLVKAVGPNGLTVTSSLSRKDTGANACEIVFVRSFERLTVQREAQDTAALHLDAPAVRPPRPGTS
jgi:hypothetical protein